MAMQAPLRGLLTWNVWFESSQFEARAAALFATVAARRPAVVALQEVTPRFLALLLREQWATETYAFSSVDTTEGDWLVNTAKGGVCPYGCLLLVDKRLHPIFHTVPLYSHMDRTLLLAYLVLPSGAEMTVGAVHLESLGTQPVRRRQLRTISRALAPVGGPAVLCGDFNFDSRRNWSAHYTCALDGVQTATDAQGPSAGGQPACGTPEHRPDRAPDGDDSELDNDCLAQILPGWTDLWPMLRPAEPGFTFDSERNSNAAVSFFGQPKYEQMRYDRILISPPLTSTVSGAAVELIGTAVCPESQCPPSDHFGVFTNWNLWSMPSISRGGTSEDPRAEASLGERMHRNLSQTFDSPDPANETGADAPSGGLFGDQGQGI